MLKCKKIPYMIIVGEKEIKSKTLVLEPEVVGSLEI